VLTVATNQTVYINEEKIALSQLAGELQTLRGESVYLRADTNVPYGTVIHVIDMIKQAGIDQLGIVTAPLVGEP
jgi:biopolymer transport protein TolR